MHRSAAHRRELAQIRKQVAGLNAEGLRVIAVAQKTNPRCVGEFGIADECDMVLMGFLAFLDPPKASAAAPSPPSRPRAWRSRS